MIESRYRYRAIDWPQRHHCHSRQVILTKVYVLPVILSILGSFKSKLVAYISRYN